MKVPDTKHITKIFLLLISCTILLSGCSSMTIIQSNPSGAKVYLNGEMVGTTPYAYADKKIIGSTTSLKLEKEGYFPIKTSFSRNEVVDGNAVVGGVFMIISFLWVMKYKPIHNYELVPCFDNIIMY